MRKLYKNQSAFQTIKKEKKFINELFAALHVACRVPNILKSQEKQKETIHCSYHDYKLAYKFYIEPKLNAPIMLINPRQFLFVIFAQKQGRIFV